MKRSSLVPNGEQQSDPARGPSPQPGGDSQLTKLYGIAGLRLGYAVAQPQRLRRWASGGILAGEWNRLGRGRAPARRSRPSSALVPEVKDGLRPKGPGCSSSWRSCRNRPDAVAANFLLIRPNRASCHGKRWSNVI